MQTRTVSSFFGASWVEGFERQGYRNQGPGFGFEALQVWELSRIRDPRSPEPLRWLLWEGFPYAGFSDFLRGPLGNIGDLLEIPGLDAWALATKRFLIRRFSQKWAQL